MWGVGCALYYALVGEVPFPQKTQEKLTEAIVEGNYNRNNVGWNRASEGGKEFIQGLLSVDPAKRMGVKEAIKHSWITTYQY